MMFWWTQRKVEGLMAASLYESLPERDQALLQRALDKDPALRSEYEAMRRIVGAIPMTPLAAPDLLPQLHQKLDTPARADRSYRLVYAGAAAIFVAGISFAAWTVTRPDASTARVAIHKSGAPNTLMAQALAEADSLVAKRDTAGAYAVLRKALSRQPGDQQAGEAQWRMASMAFELKSYPEALAAYTQLLDQYRETIEGDKIRMSEAIARRDLLTESKRVDFASLQAYDAALRDRTNTFARLEDVVVNYQGQYMVADLAAAEMARVAADDLGATDASAAGALTALKAARERCKAPVAVALLDLKMGDVYSTSLNDYSSAAVQYHRAAENPALASRANEALDRLAKLQH